MISRRTTLLIAELLEKAFHRYHSSSHGSGHYTIDTSAVYDFLFENEYPAWFCNAAKGAAHFGARPFTEFILRTHTGESLVAATENWTWPQREKLGQQLLQELAEDVVKWWGKRWELFPRGPVVETLPKCRQSLELDGYVFRGDTLLAPEADVLDVREETGVLQDLYKELEATKSRHGVPPPHTLRGALSREALG